MITQGGGQNLGKHDYVILAHSLIQNIWSESRKCEETYFAETFSNDEFRQYNVIIYIQLQIFLGLNSFQRDIFLTQK